MSLNRLIYYSTFLAGWAALFGWLLSELLRWQFRLESVAAIVILTAGLIGAAIGLGLNVVAGLGNSQWRTLLRRAGPGLLGGGLGGIVGGLIGNMLFAFELPRALGWMVMGLGIGVVEGLYDRSARKIRNGLIGGGIGGLIGGMLFDPILQWTVTDSGMTSRATAIVVLGLCIGFSIGLVQVVLRDAWLTVVDGYRTGRQLSLTRPVTMLGRSDNLPLPFVGPSNQNLELEHVRIVRGPDGSYSLEDNKTKLGTRLNNQPVEGRVQLADGDIIRLGTNLVRFNQRRRKAGEAAPAPPPVPVNSIPSPPPPPSIRQRTMGAWSQGGSIPPPLPPEPPRPPTIPPPPPPPGK
jgi:FHA domain